jgi:hypothetical protein
MEFFMKKSILASSIAAAVVGLGAVGSAQAALVNDVTGDILLVPYFSAQGGNATLLSIVNTDTQNGKAVKVRFRGAANSDDVFDFQVFLSPNDVWTANVSRGATGAAQLTTNDVSCTKPVRATLNATPFITARLDPSLTGDALMSGTREGYVEIINMADIPSQSSTSNGYTLPTTAATPTTVASNTNPLWTAIKHVSGVAPCSGAAFTALDNNIIGLTNAASGAGSAAALGMTAPSGGLFANWSIVNTTNAAAWGGQAHAISSNVSNAAGGARNVTYVSQTATALTAAQNTSYTADPLFLSGAETSFVTLTTNALTANAAGLLPVTPSGFYDLPDLSTPTETTYATPVIQATAIQGLVGKASVMAEFATESAINGATDWVFTMPTRRYAVAMAYSRITATNDGRLFNSAYQAAGVAATNVFNVTTTSMFGRLICVTGEKLSPYDREEGSPTTSNTVVVSPSAPAGKQRYCGEASVLSFNNGVATSSAALAASVAVTAIDANGYNAGWGKLDTRVLNTAVTPALTNLPILGGTFMRATAGSNGFGLFQNYR